MTGQGALPRRTRSTRRRRQGEALVRTAGVAPTPRWLAPRVVKMSMENEHIPGLAGISIERAVIDDAATFVEIHEEAARWLWEQDIRQWKPGAFQIEWLEKHIERGELYLAKANGIPVATVLLQWSDVDTWGERAPDAGYIHGLRVRRAYAGRGIGRAMLAWAEREIARAGRLYARLDCIAENPRLCAYYVDAGYERQSDLVWEEDGERGRLARFEKRVNSITGGEKSQDGSGRILPREDTIATPAGELLVRRAEPEDAAAIASIHEDSMRWAFARGFRPSGPPESLLTDALRRIAEHAVYIAWRGDTPAATLTLADDHPTVWGNLPGEATYMYAFAASRALAGQQVGLALLRWAERHVAQTGKALLRLECRANNPGLRTYYERAGYTWRGDMQVETGMLARYEKVLRTDEREQER